MLTASLYFGRAGVDDLAWGGFLAQSVTPRFPAGLTVLNGYGQWRQPASGRISAEPSSVVVLVVEPGSATLAALDSVRAEYRQRFHQDSVGLSLTESCASF